MPGIRYESNAGEREIVDVIELSECVGLTISGYWSIDGRPEEPAYLHLLISHFYLHGLSIMQHYIVMEDVALTSITCNQGISSGGGW